MEAGKDDNTTAQRAGGEDAAQTGTPHGDVAAATGEQGVTPVFPLTDWKTHDEIQADITPFLFWKLQRLKESSWQPMDTFL